MRKELRLCWKILNKKKQIPAISAVAMPSMGKDPEQPMFARNTAHMSYAISEDSAKCAGEGSRCI
jgi:hypothetical protein